MRAPISVVIPTLNVAAHLQDTLARVMEGLDAGLVRELIISDGGSSDDVEALANAVGATFVTGDAGRGGQLGRGAEAASGPWLLFLHADTWLPQGWSDVALAHVTKPERALVFSLSFRDGGAKGRAVAGWANLRTRLFGLPYGDQALLISRELFDRIGGYPDIPIMEDVAIARKLKGRIDLSRLSVQTSPERYLQDGWLRQGGRNLRRLWRFSREADPDELARGYSDR